MIESKKNSMDLISQNNVYSKGGIVLTEKVYASNGAEITRVSLSLGKNSVLVIPIDKDSNYLLVEQKRAISDKSMIEFPNGGIEKDEAELDAAKRELSEELGLEGEMVYLGKFSPFSNLVTLEVNVFLCKNAREQDDLNKQMPDFYEKIELKKFTEKEIYDLIGSGEINQSYFLSALTLYRAYNNK